MLINYRSLKIVIEDWISNPIGAILRYGMKTKEGNK